MLKTRSGFVDAASPAASYSQSLFCAFQTIYQVLKVNVEKLMLSFWGGLSAFIAGFGSI